MNLHENNLWTEIEDIQAATVSGGQVGTSAVNSPATPKAPEFTYPLRLRISGNADLALALQTNLDLNIDIGVQKGT